MRRSMITRPWLQEGVLALLVGIGVFALYMADRDVVQRSDSIWTLQVAMSLIREGNVNLDEIEHLILPSQAGTVLRVGDHLYPWFPLGPSLLITPVMALLDLVARGVRSFDLYLYVTQNPPDALLGLIELTLACGIVALTAGVLYLFGRQFLTRGQALLLVFVFAFCTSAWSTASRALWQHGPSMLLLLLALFCFVRAEKDAAKMQAAGLFLALAYVVRPTNAIPVMVFTLYVLWIYPRMAVRYLLWAAPVALAFVAYNWQLYGSILPPYFAAGRVSLHAALGEALLGNLISPSRGLFVYTPVFLLSALGVYLKRRDGALTRLDLAVLGTALFHWAVISSHWLWWAGHSYGPRLFTDMVPFFLYLLIPVIAKVAPNRETPALRARTWRYALPFWLLAGISFFMHYQGATQPATVRWNWGFEDIVPNVDQDPARVWDWSDPQFWRGLRRARIGVRPEAFVVQTAAGQPDVQELSLRLYNLGDRPLHWRALAPAAVNFVSHTAPDQFQLATSAAPGSAPIAGESSRELAFKFDVSRYPAGPHSLGGILLQATAPGGAPLVQESAVVPLSLLVEHEPQARADPMQIAPAASQPNVPAAAGLISPVDILVDGQTQQPNATEMRAIFGAGWHDLERSETDRWRWAASPAYLLIYSAAHRRIHLHMTVAAVHSPASANGQGDRGTLRVTRAAPQGESGASLVIVPGERAEATLDLTVGWNVVVLDLAEGNYRPVDLDPATGDNRLLSFALSEVDLVTE